MLAPAGLSGLETACGVVFGEAPAVRRSGAAATDPLTALIDELAEHLLRPPCVVAFSGGRDSSLVLAAAVFAARRDGLPPPLPVTLRFPGDPESEEALWQERVISHLGVEDWVRIAVPAGLDVVGEVAQPALTTYGPLYPANSHIVVPMLEHAAGGTIVSGLGGDEMFGLWTRRRIADLAARRARPQLSDVARVAGVVAPARLRALALRRRELTTRLEWLRPDAQAQLEAMLVDDQSRAPWRWDRHALGVPGWRCLTIAMRDIGRVASMGDARFAAPLIAARVATSLATAGGWRGFGGRTATLRTLFADLLPPEILQRRSKAVFSDTFFTEQTRTFAEQWSGGGLDESLVDPEVLRRTWAAPRVDFRSVLLLQSAWCSEHAAVPC